MILLVLSMTIKLMILVWWKQTDKVARWNISDVEALRARKLNMGERELSDLVDDTTIGASSILKVLEKAIEKGYIVPKGTELR